MQTAEEWFQSLIAPAGIRLNGAEPHDIQVNNQAMFQRIRRQGTLGLGNSYMDGWWDCASLDVLTQRLLTEGLNRKAGIFLPQMLAIVKATLVNLQSAGRAFEVGKKHYDLDDELFEAMLGSSMAYSSSYRGNGAKTLDEAQFAKYDLICRKLHLSPGAKVLDIGCGWGGFARYAAERYGAQVVGLTVSENQAAYARTRCQGLPVEILLQDYRSYAGKVDAIASVGMFEHVGVKNYPIFFATARRCLGRDGLFLLHTIGSLRSAIAGEPWMQTHIFPNGKLPSLRQISSAMEGRFVLEDLHNFGYDYDFTLMEWWKNFHNYVQESERGKKIDLRFQRMWQYYLLTCAGAFRARNLQLWQMVLSPRGVAGGYQPER
ncbi:MAG: cyclopropane fatty acyl phospholipid synthase [Acidobacteriaceae bacterium]